MTDWKTIPSDEQLEKTAEQLTANGMTAIIVDSKEAAKEKVLELIPEGSQVMDMTSVTVTESGLQEEILSGERFTSVKTLLSELDDTKEREKRQLGAAPDYAVGSVHAVTEEGHVLIASNTGSQMAAYVYGAKRVIWIVGAQKIVKNTEEGMKRIYDYVLPLESDRARKAYGVEGSNVSKLLIINKEVNPKRITVILIKESIGF